ncbi:MAG: class I mannose-6-phosphate isomerase [Planctomycetes bacterium]|nr:class I mannose-6-phosphate isomerase [Planctomycetota bacterium]
MSYPLRFHRTAVSKPWAGSRLSNLFPDELPAGTGESIELADMPDACSVVANGEWRGQTIRQLMEAHRQDLLGDLSGMHDLPDFPLAVKFLDTAEALSVQDHPSDLRRDGRLVQRGKSECWIVLDAEPEAVIYQGLKKGVSADEFAASLTGGHPFELMNARHLVRGDYLYNEAGMIHAIGGGLTLLEIQQNCAITYRLWDLPRPVMREMHIEAGLAAAKLDLLLPGVRGTQGEDELLQDDGPFGVRSLRVSKAFRQCKDWQGFTLLTLLEGACEVTGRARDNLQPAVLKPGDTVLYPAEFSEFEFYPQGEAWLIQSWARE